MAKKLERQSGSNESFVDPSQVPSIDRQRQMGERIRWVETNQMDYDRHGVQFLHKDYRATYASRTEYPDCLAFIDGFSWLHGGEIEIRIQTERPPSIAENQWLRIMRTVRKAVLVFLLDETRANGSFRYRPVSVCFNA